MKAFENLNFFREIKENLPYKNYLDLFSLLSYETKKELKTVFQHGFISL